MGLFDKKKKGRDDFDSPVEQIDLSRAPAAAPAAAGGGDDDEPELPAAAPAAAPSAAAPARARRSSSTVAYGIDDAIALMRTLPGENVELVVQVVKHTLESARIDIGAIIEDATGKQQRIESRVAVLRDAIAELEREIQARRAEIAELEADHRETTRVKDRLVLAQKLTGAALTGAALPGAAPAADPAPAPAAPARAARSTGEVGRAKPATNPPPLPGVPPSTGTAAGTGSLPPPHPGGGAGSGPGSGGSHTVVSKK
ncbi:MAG TPA: hypothetical protein VKZ63_10540 [Kofleriaceae bacterium]|nr:hypothetical protein [Kofleriaceae bacterium]